MLISINSLNRYNKFIIFLLVFCLLFCSFLGPQVHAIPIVAVPILLEVFACALVSIGIVSYTKMNDLSFDKLWLEFKQYVEEKKMMATLVAEAQREFVTSLKNKSKMRLTAFANVFNSFIASKYSAFKYQVGTIANTVGNGIDITGNLINDFSKNTFDCSLLSTADCFSAEFHEKNKDKFYNLSPDMDITWIGGVQIAQNSFIGLCNLNNWQIIPVYYDSLRCVFLPIVAFVSSQIEDIYLDSTSFSTNMVYVADSNNLAVFKKNYCDDFYTKDGKFYLVDGLQTTSEHYWDSVPHADPKVTMSVNTINNKVSFYYQINYPKSESEVVTQTYYTSDLFGGSSYVGSDTISNNYVPSFSSDVLNPNFVPSDVNADVAFPHSLGGLGENVRDLTAEQIYQRYLDSVNSVDVAHAIIDGKLEDAKTLSIDFVDSRAVDVALDNVIPAEASSGASADVMEKLGILEDSYSRVNGKVQALDDSLSGVNSRVNDLTDRVTSVQDKTSSISDSLEKLKSIPTWLTESPNVSLNLDAFKDIKLYEKFPFSLPWDLRNSVKTFVKPGVAPKWETQIQNVPIVIDFSKFETLALISRSFLYIIFCVVLIILTRKFLSW